MCPFTTIPELPLLPIHNEIRIDEIPLTIVRRHGGKIEKCHPVIPELMIQCMCVCGGEFRITKWVPPPGYPLRLT